MNAKPRRFSCGDLMIKEDANLESSLTNADSVCTIVLLQIKNSWIPNRITSRRADSSKTFRSVFVIRNKLS